MSQAAGSTATAPTKMEVRSIDYVPISERHGKPWHLGPVWFQGNAQLATVAVGLIGPSVGLNFAWSAVAIILGALIGTLFMAFHSAQGPKLGLPQMIQSRPQFGYYGSLLPVIVAVLLFIGYNVFNTVIGGQTMQAVLHTNHPPVWSYTTGTLLIVALALLLTIFGYDLIHATLRWATYLFLAAFGVFTIVAIANIHLSAAQLSLSGGHFMLAAFMLQFGAVVSYQLTWAPYVSEYSRYLPQSTTTAETFWWTYIGSGIGAVWMMVLGAFIISPNPTAGEIATVHGVANTFFQGFGWIVLLCAIPGLVAVIAMNMYSGGLALLATVDVVKRVKPTLSARWLSVGFITVAATALGLAVPANFIPYFSIFLTTVLYFMIPWTAVNLIDFFFVRKGNYAIAEIYKPHGIYHAWGWRGITAYIAGFCAMIPFMDISAVGVSLNYVGVVAQPYALGGDISPFIGFPVAAILYYILARNVDVAAEKRIADAQRADLEAEAMHHELIDVAEPAPS